MAEQATTEQHRVRLYAFGEWSKAELPAGADPTPIGRRLIDFLTGSYQGPLTEREAACLYEEFVAMERYRVLVVNELLKCGGLLQQDAARAVREQDGPFRVSGSYQSGLNLGRCIAYGDAAQRVQNVINAVSISTQDANDKLTAERVARLEKP